MGLFSPGEVRSLAKPAGAENLDTLDDVANAEAPSDRGGVCGAGDGGGDWPYVASELVGGLFHVFLGGDPLARSGDLRDVASEAHVASALRDVARRVGRAPGGLGALRVAARVPGRASADEILGAADPLVALAAEHAGEPVARAACLEALARLCEASAAARRRVSRAERVYDVVHRSLKSPLWRASAKHPKSPALRALLAKAYPNYYEPEASLGCRLLMHLLPCDPPPGVDLGGIGTALLILLDGTRDAKRRPIVVAATCLAMLCATANRSGLAAVCKSNLQPDFNVRVCEWFDTSSSAVLREHAESNRFVQKSAESTSI